MRAKVRSVIIVASPLAAVGPMIAAGVTGEWRYLPAGIAVGIAGLLAGAGGAIVQSTIVPIAVPALRDRREDIEPVARYLLSRICARLGRDLKWDPVKEQFIDDDEANRMISRTLRHPWHL